MEAVLKLYEAIKNKDVHQLSDIIAEECSCISNFVSAFQPFLGKKVGRLHGYHLQIELQFQIKLCYDDIYSKVFVFPGAASFGFLLVSDEMLGE